MGVIDAHIHCFDCEPFEQLAIEAGSVNTMAGLQSAMTEAGIRLAIAMGNAGEEEGEVPLRTSWALDGLTIPIAECIGIDEASVHASADNAVLDRFDKALAQPTSVGLKVYAGYRPIHVADKRYHPFYELARAHDVPVVIHTGETALPQALLKYAHPLTVDELAVQFPDVRFVMAHTGNPWIIDAVQVARKNPNVYLELSGLFAGRFDARAMAEEERAYLDYIRMWMKYLGRYDKILYGSDWPLVNQADYQELMATVIPSQHHQAFFYDNARAVFTKIDAMLTR
ncbi:MAG: amidohydrolase family protein [Selenomonadales bacterium]|nr:amidohydrolase family protein [Selenomonadales bacterium]